MTNNTDKAVKVSQEVIGRGLIPFTGPFFAIYAFFWPDSFGRWWGTILGTIVHLTRTIGGV